MLIRFDRETKKLIKEIQRKVAIKLNVDKCTLALDTGENGLFFESNVDNVYAELEVDTDDHRVSFENVLKGFMKNPDVIWNCNE